jgi:FkbM family methyltransferase
MLYVRLAEKSMGRRNRYRLFGHTLLFDDPESVKHTLTEHFGGHVNFFHASRPDPVIIDVGANIGDTVMYFKWLYPQARIWAFEPGQRAFELLKECVKINAYKDVVIFREALSNRDGDMPLLVQRGHFLGSSGSQAWQDALRVQGEAFISEMVPVRRFSDRVKELGIRHIDLLKIDIEGGESELLVDAEDILAYTDRVILEYHVVEQAKQNSFDAINDVLHRAGFEIRVFGCQRSNDNWYHTPVFMIVARKRGLAE